METSVQGAPAPAPLPPGKVVDVSVAPEAAAQPNGVNQVQLNAMIAAAVAQAMQTGKKPEVIVSDEMALGEVLPPPYVNAMNEKQKLFFAKVLDSHGEHSAARALRGKKGTLFEKTLAIGETGIKVKHVVQVMLGGIVFWAIYELVASKMDWSFRVGIWDSKPARR